MSPRTVSNSRSSVRRKAETPTDCKGTSAAEIADGAGAGVSAGAFGGAATVSAAAGTDAADNRNATANTPKASTHALWRCDWRRFFDKLIYFSFPWS